MTAGLLFMTVGCASLDAARDPAWRIDPVLEFQHSLIAARGHYAVGRYYDGMQAWNKAVDAYQRAVLADPQHAEAQNALGVALARIGRHGDAELALRRAVALEPTRAHMRSNLGFMMLRSGRLSEALVELKAAVRLDPRSATAKGNLREAVARRESDQIGESHAAPAQTRPMSPVLEQAMTTSAPLDADTISMPAPITTANLRAPFAGAVQVAAPLPGPSVNAPQRVEVFDQPTIAAWPRAVASDLRRSETAGGTLAGAESGARRLQTSSPAASASTMQVRLAAQSTSVALLASPTANAEKAGAWDAGVRLELSNGNGVSGMAAQLDKWLARQGVRANRLTNRHPFNQKQTTVEYRAGQEDAAWRLVRALPFTVHVDPVMREGLNTDVRLILGSDWRAANDCLAHRDCHSSQAMMAARVPFTSR